MKGVPKLNLASFNLRPERDFHHSSCVTGAVWKRRCGNSVSFVLLQKLPAAVAAAAAAAAVAVDFDLIADCF